MGKRGRAPMPKEVLERRGSWKAKRIENHPQPPSGAPEMPGYLDELAKEVWSDLMDILNSMNLLTTADAGICARYCRLMSKYIAAEEFMQKNGETDVVRNDAGRIQRVGKFPQVDMAIKYADQLLRIEQQLGLSPSARTSIRLPKDKDVNKDKLRFFNGRLSKVAGDGR